MTLGGSELVMCTHEGGWWFCLSCIFPVGKIQNPAPRSFVSTGLLLRADRQQCPTVDVIVDIVRYKNSMNSSFVYQPPDIPIKILHHDKDVLVAVKPSGLLSVPGRGDDRYDSMLTRLQQIDSRVLAVHRLDMDTSGLMVFALRKKAERSLKLQFQQRRIEKCYQAMVQGHLGTTEGKIEFPLGPDPQQRLRHRVDPQGKKALTEYRVLDRGDNCCLLALYPRTGRSHQLRVHLLAIGHPILGDRFYASMEVQQRASRLQLHAQSIQFEQPYSGKVLVFEEPSGFDVTKC